MENKTCGECKYFILNSSGFCKSNEGQEDSGNDCCSFFVPKAITNGDVIRQMSNEKLKKVIKCPYPDDICICRHDEYPCECCKRDWLNAPAESEVEDV